MKASIHFLGIVSPGKLADLILLDTNLRENIGNTPLIRTVVLTSWSLIGGRGTNYPQAERRANATAK